MPVPLPTVPDTFVSDIFRETEVGARYAKAVFELAEAEGVLEAVRTDLVTLKSLLVESADLRRLLASHAFSSDDKLKGLTAVTQKAGFNALTQKALGLVGRNGRLGQVPALITAFQRLYDAKKGIVAAQVTSAVALDEAQLAALKSELAKSLGRDPVIDAIVDPAILGGLKVRVGSRLFDASLKTQLDSLKFALKRA